MIDEWKYCLMYKTLEKNLRNGSELSLRLIELKQKLGVNQLFVEGKQKLLTRQSLTLHFLDWHL